MTYEFCMLYILGFVLCAYAVGYTFWQMHKNDYPHINPAFLPGIAGFSVFPILNLAIGVWAWLYLLTKQSK